MPRLFAAALALALAGCSSSLGQTMLPDTPGQQPAAPAAQGSGTSTDNTTDRAPVSDSGDDAPDASSQTEAPSTAASTSPAAPSPAPGPILPAAMFRTDAGGAVSGGYHGAALSRAFGRSTACSRAAPYCASDVQSAYGLTAAAKDGGRGLTVAVVAAYGYPGAASDVSVYRKSMGLPACTTLAGCFKVVNESGRSSPLPGLARSATSWPLEAALQLDMVSATCPNCKIVLVLARSDADADLAAAVDAAAAAGAAAISTGFAGPEVRASEPAYDRPGRVITAAAGDDGYGARQPCSFAGVVCVGGTSLTAPAGSGRPWGEQAWRYTGSGCSARVPKPQWQHDKDCAMRATADVAAVADPQTGVAVYDAAGGGWLAAGGTAAGSAIVAALFALGPSVARANAPAWIWRHGGSPAYRDVTEGSNGSCSIQYLCQGREGYDGPTGWGTPARASGF